MATNKIYFNDAFVEETEDKSIENDDSHPYEELNINANQTTVFTSEISDTHEQTDRTFKENGSKTIWRKIMLIVVIASLIIAVTQVLVTFLVLKSILKDDISDKYSIISLDYQILQKNISILETKIQKFEDVLTNTTDNIQQQSGVEDLETEMNTLRLRYDQLKYIVNNLKQTLSVKDCGLLPYIPFSSFTYNSTRVGSVATYSCPNGFSATGKTILKCQENGYWSKADLVCVNTLTRLAGSTSKDRGRVEINYFGIWGTVCDDGWDDKDATVACKQLGFG